MQVTKIVFALIAGICGAPAMAALTLTSTDLENGALIASAQIYPRCGGENISPQLSWSGASAGTKSFVLTMIDTSVKPDQWSHWIMVDIPANVTSLARGMKTPPAGARQISSNFGEARYDGPCPPPGSGRHQYELTIWALPTQTFSAAADMKASELYAALASVALAHATLVGSVTR
jgi:Raf kinase inhibitor-like YbhB/YbcL family protein